MQFEALTRPKLGSVLSRIKARHWHIFSFELFDSTVRQTTNMAMVTAVAKMGISQYSQPWQSMDHSLQPSSFLRTGTAMTWLDSYIWLQDVGFEFAPSEQYVSYFFLFLFRSQQWSLKWWMVIQRHPHKSGKWPEWSCRHWRWDVVSLPSIGSLGSSFQGGVLISSITQEKWHQTSNESDSGDFFQTKRYTQKLLASFGTPPPQFRPATHGKACERNGHKKWVFWAVFTMFRIGIATKMGKNHWISLLKIFGPNKKPVAPLRFAWSSTASPERFPKVSDYNLNANEQ